MLYLRVFLTCVMILALTGTAHSKDYDDDSRDQVRQMWKAVQKASPEFSKLFCSDKKAVCVADWPSFRSPLGGWRLIDPKKCEVDPLPCPLGAGVNLSELDFTTGGPPPIGPVPSWAPCDVFPDDNNPSVLVCDDTCGCTILRWNCAGTWSCTSDECKCSP